MSMTYTCCLSPYRTSLFAGGSRPVHVKWTIGGFPCVSPPPTGVWKASSARRPPSAVRWGWVREGRGGEGREREAGSGLAVRSRAVAPGAPVGPTARVVGGHVTRFIAVWKEKDG